MNKRDRGRKENSRLEAHLLLSLSDFTLRSLCLAGSLSTAAQRVHHDGHHVLVHTQDADQDGCLDEGLRGPADDGINEHLLELVGWVQHLRFLSDNFLCHFLLLATQNHHELGHHSFGLWSSWNLCLCHKSIMVVQELLPEVLSTGCFLKFLIS
ncbi:hypothetical protein E2C01_004891 [Portunus trituberculatus]|uniref:Uncharacterized protein n=1 Tax=Portunus trituberculatus TaxID=210409 RepID=A0A5B7CXN4_PORTR|nr:hypothetical protein [Portunus trituberculatus]